MTALITFLVSAVGQIFGTFTALATQRLATTAVWVTIFVALAGTGAIAIQALLDSVSVNLPSWVVIPATWFVPSGSSTYVSVILSAQAIKYAFDLNAHVLSKKL